MKKNKWQQLCDTEKFLKTNSQMGLCNLLNTSLFELHHLVNQPIYHEFEISKSRGGRRTISAPDKRLKEALRQLNYYLQNVYTPIMSESSHGFIANTFNSLQSRNIVTNAQPHIRKSFVLNMDLRNFFHSISASRVRQIFKSKPFFFSEDIATILALLCTYQKHLPMGAPTSPVLSNFACIELDKTLQHYCNKHQLTYTRYADDLTFSSDTMIEETSKKEITAIISSLDFAVNTKKTRLHSKHGRQSVTGVKVNEKPNVKREYIRHIRAVLHHWQTQGLSQAVILHFQLSDVPDERHIQWFIKRIKGKINFIGMVRGKSDKIYIQFSNKYTELFNRYSLRDDN